MNKTPQSYKEAVRLPNSVLFFINIGGETVHQASDCDAVSFPSRCVRAVSMACSNIATKQAVHGGVGEGKA